MPDPRISDDQLAEAVAEALFVASGHYNHRISHEWTHRSNANKRPYWRRQASLALAALSPHLVPALDLQEARAERDALRVVVQRLHDGWKYKVGLTGNYWLRAKPITDPHGPLVIPDYETEPMESELVASILTSLITDDEPGRGR